MSIPEHSILQLAGPDGTAEFDVDPAREVFVLKMGKESKKFNRIDLWALVYAISGPEQQDKMMPVRRSEVLTYRRIHKIRLKKAMPEGGIITCRCEINVEKVVVEGLNGMIEQQAKKLDVTTGVPMIGMGR
ncbi:MAG: hypothetical protein V4481_05085 [Patescibacteria group bacterium]